MSCDFDTENIYMVEFKSGRVIYTSFYELEDVKQYCAEEYPSEVIKTIYIEVYVGDDE